MTTFLMYSVVFSGAFGLFMCYMGAHAVLYELRSGDRWDQLFAVCVLLGGLATVATSALATAGVLR